MDYREQILSFLHVHGPSVPNEVKKHINKDSLMASAMLSELSSTGKVIISSLKMGSSPLYYLPGQQDQLQKFTSYLHEKEQKVFLHLQEKKMLRDSACDALTQQCLRNIKDFAVPLHVTFEGKQELFWKWYLVPDTEVNSLIGELLQPPQTQITEQPPLLQQNQPLEKKVSEIKQLKTKKIKELKLVVKEEKQTLIEEKTSPEPITSDDLFYHFIKKYCDDKKIMIHSLKPIKKEKEYNLMISFSSAVGDVHYFCKAKNKKRINPDELSSAYLEASEYKLPVLFLAPGELTKKAEDLILHNLKGMKFSQLS